MSLLRFFRLSSTFVDIGIQMKQMNDAKQFHKAISLFNRYLQKQPTPLIISQALKACIHLKDFHRGKTIHQQLSPPLLSDPFVRTNLIQLYMKCNEIDKAQKVFSTTTNKTIVMYNTIFDGLRENNRGKEALQIFEQMPIPPDEYTFVILLKICTQLSDPQSFEFGRSLWKKISVNNRKNPVISTSFLHMLLKHEEISICEQFFSQIEKDNVTFTVMMKGYLEHQMPQKAIDLYLRIDKPNETNAIVFFNACAELKDEKTLVLVKKIFSQLPRQFHQSRLLLQTIFNTFCRCNDISTAESLFELIHRDVIAYGSLMKTYNNQDEPEKTLQLFERMKHENIQANSIIYVLVINACANIRFLSLSQSIVRQIPRHLLNNRWIRTSLIDMWESYFLIYSIHNDRSVVDLFQGKSGSLEEAKLVFGQTDQPNSVSFTTMINAYGLNGKGEEALELFNRIPLDMIDEWTYVCVLNACSHSGLIDEGEKIFKIIPQEKKTEKIYTSMIDGFSRSFQFDRAQYLMDEFEKNHSPSIHMYTAMLSGARNAKNTYLSQKIFDLIRLLFSHDESSLASATILLANAYGLTGDLPRTSELRTEMSQSKLKKVPGRSSTMVNGELVHFYANDRSHPLSNEIYHEISQLGKELVEQGYQCDPSWISRPLTSGETNESVLWGHSEKLAIAFQLIQHPKPSVIQVVKNLRICGDCHTAIKLIARIRQCLIVVHDANRIHHFDPTGNCSCNDRF